MRLDPKLLAFIAVTLAVTGLYLLIIDAQRLRPGRLSTGFRRSLREVLSPDRSVDLKHILRVGTMLAVGALPVTAIWFGFVTGLLVAVAVLVFFPVVVNYRRARYRKRLRNEVATVERALADVLSGGYPVRTAFAEVAATITGPAKRQISQLARELALGVEMDAALARLQTAAGSLAWDTFAAAVLIQRDSGGDLASLLRDLADAFEESERAMRDAKSATVQARFTAWIVLALPGLAAVFSELVSPGFIGAMFASSVSALLVVIAIGLELVALLLIRKVCKGLELVT